MLARVGVRRSSRLSETRRCRAHQAAEMRRQMALIAESGLKGDSGNGKRARGQQCLRPLDASTDQILMRGKTSRFVKSAAEMCVTDPRDRSEVSQRDLIR